MLFVSLKWRKNRPRLIGLHHIVDRSIVWKFLEAFSRRKPHFSEYTNTLLERRACATFVTSRAPFSVINRVASASSARRDTSIGVVRQIDRGWRYVYVRKGERKEHTHLSFDISEHNRHYRVIHAVMIFVF